MRTKTTYMLLLKLVVKIFEQVRQRIETTLIDRGFCKNLSSVRPTRTASRLVPDETDEVEAHFREITVHAFERVEIRGDGLVGPVGPVGPIGPVAGFPSCQHRQMLFGQLRRLRLR